MFVPLDVSDADPVSRPTLSAWPGPMTPTSATSTSNRTSPDAPPDPSCPTGHVLDGPAQAVWFATPETWEVDHFLPAEDNTFSTAEAKEFIDKVQDWLTDYMETGSNEFIHSELYQSRFPKCMQDAYSTLSLYRHKTKSNETVVYRIIEDRARALVAEDDSSSYPSPGRASHSKRDALAHLARVQSLLIYQCICLFDGDVRLRSAGVAHMPVLDSWMEHMAQCARETRCLGSCLVAADGQQLSLGYSFSDIARYDNLLWYSWILAESIRRTWHICSGVHAFFVILQNGRAACKGAMMVTTRQGVWEAPSSVAWGKICSEVNVGLMQREDMHSIFTSARPDDINEFSHLVLWTAFGHVRMERWKLGVPG